MSDDDGAAGPSNSRRRSKLTLADSDDEKELGGGGHPAAEAIFDSSDDDEDYGDNDAAAARPDDFQYSETRTKDALAALQSYLSPTPTPRPLPWSSVLAESMKLQQTSDLVIYVVEYAAKITWEAKAVIMAGAVRILLDNDAVEARKLFKVDKAKKAPDRLAHVMSTVWLRECINLCKNISSNEQYSQEEDYRCIFLIQAMNFIKNPLVINSNRKVELMKNKQDMDWKDCVEKTVAIAKKVPQWKALNTASASALAYLQKLVSGNAVQAPISVPPTSSSSQSIAGKAAAAPVKDSALYNQATGDTAKEKQARRREERMRKMKTSLQVKKPPGVVGGMMGAGAMPDVGMPAVPRRSSAVPMPAASAQPASDYQTNQPQSQLFPPHQQSQVSSSYQLDPPHADPSAPNAKTIGDDWGVPVDAIPEDLMASSRKRESSSGLRLNTPSSAAASGNAGANSESSDRIGRWKKLQTNSSNLRQGGSGYYGPAEGQSAAQKSDNPARTVSPSAEQQQQQQLSQSIDGSGSLGESHANSAPTVNRGYKTESKKRPLDDGHNQYPSSQASVPQRYAASASQNANDYDQSMVFKAARNDGSDSARGRGNGPQYNNYNNAPANVHSSGDGGRGRGREHTKPAWMTQQQPQGAPHPAHHSSSAVNYSNPPHVAPVAFAQAPPAFNDTGGSARGRGRGRGQTLPAWMTKQQQQN